MRPEAAQESNWQRQQLLGLEEEAQKINGIDLESLIDGRILQDALNREE